MAHLSTACLIVMLILLSKVPAILCAFATTPTSVNATLGSTATFNCSATAGAVVWMVNGSLLTQLNTDNTDIRTSSVGPTFCLHIPATEKYNNTNVICRLTILGENGEDLYSDPVVLRVQGLLAVVQNLTVHSQRSSILLTWIPPFSLDITGVDPDLWYCVEVYNISWGRAALTANCSVHEPHFYFTAPNRSPCDLFQFRIFAVNQVGNGSVTSVNGTFNKKPVLDDTIQVESFSILEIKVNILFSSYLDVYVYNGQVVENITLATVEGSGLHNLVTDMTDTTIQFNHSCTIAMVSVSSPATTVIMVIGTVAILLYWKWKQHTYNSPTDSPESLQTLPESATVVLIEGNTPLPLPNQTHPGSLLMTVRDKVPNFDIVPRKTLPASTIFDEEPPPPPLPTKTCHGRPLTLDTHSSVLNSTVSPKWQKLGELLGMDEHRLDEIFTNNKTNEEHLRAVLEVWLRKSNNSKWSDVDDTFSNIDETGNKGYSSCDPDLENATEEKGDASELHVPDEVLGKPYQSTDHLPVSQSQESQCLLGVSVPRVFVDHAEEPFHDGEVNVPQEFVEGPLVQYTTETTVITRSRVIHIVAGSVIYTQKHNSSRTHVPSGGHTYSIQLPICEVPDTQGNQSYLACVDPALEILNRDMYKVPVEDTNQRADDECVGFESAGENNGAFDSASSPALNDTAEVRDKG